MRIHIQLKAVDTFALSGGNSRREINLLIDTMIEDRVISKEKMEVGPTAHYSMGGVAVDVNCRTKIRGLFAVGEVISQIHGANRLGGNSLLDTVVFGKIAAGEVAKYAKEIIERQKTGPSLLGSNINKQVEFHDGIFIVNEPVTFLNEIQELMKYNAGIMRRDKASKRIKKNFGIKEGILFQR